MSAVYAAPGELFARLGGSFSSLYSAPDGTPMEAEAAADLAAAQAEVDGFCGVRYQVPVLEGAALPLLKNWTLTLAEELAWCRGGQAEIPEGVKERIANCRKQLQMVAGGKLSLSGAEERADGASSVSLVECSTPVFRREKIRR